MVPAPTTATRVRSKPSLLRRGPDYNARVTHPPRKVDLIGVPLDLGAGRRGVDMGPSAFRLTGLGARIAALGHEVVDRGDVRVPIPETTPVGGERKRYAAEIGAVCRTLAGMTAESVGSGRTPIALGGDHSLAAGAVAGVARALRARRADLALLWIDAHADMNTPETSPSGNVHGMPLAACLGQGIEELTSLSEGAPSVKPENVVLFGIRDLDERERGLVKQSGV